MILYIRINNLPKLYCDCAGNKTQQGKAVSSIYNRGYLV